jgi:hypothetical protein
MKTALLRNGCASEYWLRTTRSVLAIGIVAALALPNRLLAQKQETIGPPSIKVEVIAGQGATNNTRTRKAVEPIALVTDERGQPVSGVMVVFTLPETGPGGAFVDESKRAIVYTNAEGKATARGLTPNTTPGKFQIMVNASFQGFTSSTTVYQTNVSPSVRRVRPSSLPFWRLLVEPRQPESSLQAAAEAHPKVLRFLRAALRQPLLQERPFSVLRNNEFHKEGDSYEI